MVAAAVAAIALACTPQPGLGSLSYTRGGAQHVLDLATCRERVRRAAKPQQHALVSPDGRLTANERISGGKDTIRIGGKTVLSLPRWSPSAKNGSPGPIMLLGWSGDSRWVFYAIDPMGSASIIADGVLMQAVSVNGTVRTVTSGLAYDDYRTWCNGRLILTAGGDRIAAHHKRLVTVAPPAWRPKALVPVAGQAWGSIACAPDGRTVVVQSQRDAGTNMSSVWAHWALWRVGFDGSQHRLTSPPPGYSDDSPRFSNDGRTLFFVRSRRGVGRVYGLRNGKLLGPFASLGYQLGYYGHHAWPYSVRR
jgi:hypothetical protein